MDPTRPDLIDQLVEGVTASAKYQPISSDLVRWIGARELAQTRSLKEAIKATRNKLHQVASSYQENKIHYDRCLTDLTAAVNKAESTGQPDARTLTTRKSQEIQAVLKSIMRLHASTFERLPILDDFYTEILGPIGPVHSILDLACGLNPLAAAWMPLAPGATYHALDIYRDMIDFINQVFGLFAQPGRAEQANILQGVPEGHTQVALLLKTLPCLEQVDKTISPRLLGAIQADVLIVSYPVASLGGRTKGMRSFYEAHFKTLVAGQPWKIEKLDFATELVFRVTR
jgi:16S rRNA (guanine(1405)-N(7))-methyltransferase